MPETFTESDLGTFHRVPLAGFVDHLRQHGFVVGLNHYARLLLVLDMLDADCPPARLKTLLAPLFATTPAKQEQFYCAFDAFFPLFAAGVASRARNDARDQDDDADRSSPRRPPLPRVRRTRVFLFVAANLIALALAVAWAWRVASRDNVVTSQRPAPIVKPGGTAAATPAPTAPAPAPSAPVSAPSAPASSRISSTPAATVSPVPDVRPAVGWMLVVGVPSLLFGVFVVAELRAVVQRRLLLERRRRAKPPITWPVRVFDQRGPYRDRPDIHLAARHLRARESSDARALDVQQTVRATIEAHGFPTFRYVPVTRPPEYLVLIERASRYDHQADLFGELSDALENEGVHVAEFYYDTDPRVCRADDGTALLGLRPAQRYPDHRLLVFGSGETMTEPISGRLAAWVPQFLTWRDRALTPVRRPVGAPERSRWPDSFSFFRRARELCRRWWIRLPPPLDSILARGVPRPSSGFPT